VGSGEVLLITSGDARTRNVKVLDAWSPVLSVTVAAKLNVLELVGVPLSTPALDRVTPPGNEPPVRLQLYGAVPPEAVSVCE